PFADATFDYVVSLDVLGHVPFEEKDAVLAEVRRVLRPAGVTMHGIECTGRRAQKTYRELSAEELRRLVAGGGHGGVEEAPARARIETGGPHVEVSRPFCLDRAGEFDDGWYEPNTLPPVARWMKRRGRVLFRAPSLSALRLDLTTHMPDIGARPLGLELSLNG